MVRSAHTLSRRGEHAAAAITTSADSPPFVTPMYSAFFTTAYAHGAAAVTLLLFSTIHSGTTSASAAFSPSSMCYRPASSNCLMDCAFVIDARWWLRTLAHAPRLGGRLREW